VNLTQRASPLGAKGLGELTAVSVPPTIANAVYHATGKRLRDLPITIEKLLRTAPRRRSIEPAIRPPASSVLPEPERVGWVERLRNPSMAATPAMGGAKRTPPTLYRG
jgi:hypothetical protein